MNITKMTFMIFIITIAIIMAYSNLSDDKMFFKNEVLILYKNDKLKLQLQDPNYPKDAVFNIKDSKCEINPMLSINFYDENSKYKNIDEFLTIHTKKGLFVTKLVSEVTKKKTKDERTSYSFARQSIKVLNPRTLNAKEIPILEYYILITAKDNKGFYEIFYEGCEKEKNKVKLILEELLKSIKFLR